MHTTVQDRVTEALRVKILSGELGAGERLRQEDIAEQFAVSHIPVREALRQLTAEGLVSIEAHKGATVASLSRRQLQEIVQLRQLLEPEVLAIAIPKFTQTDVTVAQKTLQALRKNKSSSSYAARNWDFHCSLLRPADAPLALSIVQRLHLIGERYLKLEQDLDKVDEEHQAILDFVKLGDVENAVCALRVHIGELSDRVVMQRPKETPPA